MKNKIILFAFAAIFFASVSQALPSKQHVDYVPNEITAKKIGEAVLAAKFGEGRLKEQLPLNVVFNATGRFWIVYGRRTDSEETGGGMAVWIDKNSGCIENILDHMK